MTDRASERTRSPGADDVTHGPVRFAVVTCSEFATPWELACVRSLIDSGEAELAARFTLPRDPGQPSAGIGRRAYEFFVRRGSRSLLPRTEWALELKVPAEPLDSAASAFAHVDLVLSFARPDALSTIDPPPLGLWWFRLGGRDHDCEKIPFLDAVATASPTLEFELLRRGSEREPQVLSRVVRKARRSHSLSADLLLDVAPVMCVGACRRMRTSPPALSAARAGRTPDETGLAARAVVAQVVGTVSRAVRRGLMTDVWTIGVLPTTAKQVLAGASLPEPLWLDAPVPGEFHADPFPLSVGGTQYLLYEHFDAVIRRGRIAAVEVGASDRVQFRDAVTILPMDCHMSYPAVFHYEGSTFCAPEVSERGGLCLYRLGSNAQEWTFVCRTLDEVPLLDPTLFEHEGRWWLLATVEGAASDVDLFAWYAQTPFGPWTAHRLNPIKSDVFAARPAGSVFRIQDALYRPAQDCSRGYGYGVTICEIARLDPDHFEEFEIRRLRPEPGWAWPDGMHTFNVWGERILVDARRSRIRRPATFGRRTPA